MSHKGEIAATPAEARPSRPRDAAPPRRSTRVEVNGWINLDKPVGVTSTQAVAQLKYLFNAKKAGHAGTLDPLASGVLPVAFGEATKTVPVVQEGVKAYRFAVKWGEETDTDDAEGRIVAQLADARPTRAEIEAALPRFVGLIRQTPPMFSAIKIAGERAYDLARDGEAFEIAARPIVVHRLELVEAGRGRGDLRGRMRQGRLCARDRARPRAARSVATAMSRRCAAPASARSGGERSVPSSVAPIARGARAPRCSASRRAWRSWRCVAIDRTAPRSCAADKNCCCAARRRREGPAYAARLGAPVALGKSRAAISSATRVFNLPG